MGPGLAHESVIEPGPPEVDPFGSEDHFFRRVPQGYFDPDFENNAVELTAQAFQNPTREQAMKLGLEGENAKAMSVDWCRLATPDETRGRMTDASERPASHYGVAMLEVAFVRRLKHMKTRFSPISNHPTLPDNPAHSDIVGPKSETELRRENLALDSVARSRMQLAAKVLLLPDAYTNLICAAKGEHEAH